MILLIKSGVSVIIWHPNWSAWIIFKASLGLAHNISEEVWPLLRANASLIIGTGSIPVSAILPANIDKIIFESFLSLFNTNSIWFGKKMAVTLQWTPSWHKVCINSGAIQNPSRLRDLSQEFGSQAIVLQLDARLLNSEFRAFYNTGRELSDFKIPELLNISQDNGIGEIIVTSIEKVWRKW